MRVVDDYKGLWNLCTKRNVTIKYYKLTYVVVLPPIHVVAAQAFWLVRWLFSSSPVSEAFSSEASPGRPFFNLDLLRFEPFEVAQ